MSNHSHNHNNNNTTNVISSAIITNSTLKTEPIKQRKTSTNSATTLIEITKPKTLSVSSTNDKSPKMTNQAPKRRRNRPKGKQQAQLPEDSKPSHIKQAQIIEIPKLMDCVTKKPEQSSNPGSFTHTVFGGLTKDYFQNNKLQSQPIKQNYANSYSNQPRQVTVTASKSVIVSILDTNLNQANSTIEETSYSLKSYSSSYNDKDSHLMNNFNTNQNNLSSSFKNDQFNKFEIELERNYVFRVKKSRNLKYRCNICNYFCDTMDVARKHINGSIHKSNLDTIRLEMRIRDLEMPSSPKLNNLNTFLVDFYNKTVISSEKLKQFYDIYYKFKSKFLEKYPDAIVNIYGSVAHGVCFNDSSCDISIDYDSNKQGCKSSSQILNDLTDLIKNDLPHLFEPLSTQSSRQSPKKTAMSSKTSSLNKISFQAVQNSSLVFNFTSSLYPSAYKTSLLIKSYLELDDRARLLAFCFRYIAKISQIDKVDLCTLPPHAYILMAIYFLQKLHPPVLPVLHELIDSKKLTKKFSSNMNIAQSPLKKRLSSMTREKSDSTNEYLDENSFDEFNNNNNSNSTIDDIEFFSDQQIQPGTNHTTERDNADNFNIFKKNLQSYVNGQHWKSSNQNTAAELWLKLLAFYSVDFGFKKTFISVRRQSRISKSSVKMYTKKMSIEDPFCLKQSLSRNLMTQTNKYIILVISKACLYFVQNAHSNSQKLNTEQKEDEKVSKIVESLIDETGILDARKAKKELENGSEIESGEEDDDEDEDETESEDDKLSDSETELMEHLVGFLNDSETNKNKNKKSKNLNKRLNQMLKITNLDLKQDSLGPSLSSMDTNSSLSTPLETEAHKFIFINDNEEDSIGREEDEIVEEDYFDQSLNSLGLNEPNEIGLNEKFKSLQHESSLNDHCKLCLNDLVNKVVEIHEAIFDDQMPNVQLKSYNDCSSTKISDLNLSFKFTPSALNISRNPPKICSHCNKEGHLQAECPQDQLPDLDKLPDMTHEWRMVLTNVCHCVMEDNRQTKDEEAIRNKLLKDIKQIIFQKYPDARLSLFGSSNNGFAMKKSDLDICMTLEYDPYGDEINFKRIIRTIGGLFRRENDFDQVEERVSAKVPIVKFRHKKTMIEGDISLYNTLALQNTDLLRSYGEIDPRLKVLGHVVKHFAKTCRIGDASCGSLSSYAYIIMMLHYLMNTDPPVLPCLQKLNRDGLPKHETALVIDGWDCWFNRDLDNLNTHWPHFKKNDQTVGELWLGFLRYYTEIFDWDNHVVCIRDNNPLTRKSKSWTKHRLAIEDPFELSHNLAAGVSHKMGLYILKSFAKARGLFGQVVHDFRSDEIRFNIDYFFNPRSLIEGPPPMDRNCFSCSKIGHQTKDCPLGNVKRRDKQQSDPDQYKQQGDGTGVLCFKCRNHGHIAKDCLIDQKRSKTVSVSYAMDKCFKCNQLGHYARDCTVIPNQQGKIQIQLNIPHVPHQQSAPAPKMISLINPSNSKSINNPVFYKTGDNYQMVVNNSSGSCHMSSVSSAPIMTDLYVNGDASQKMKQAQYHNSNYQHGHHSQQQHQTQILLQRQQSYPFQCPKEKMFQDYHNNQNQEQLNQAANHYTTLQSQYSYSYPSPIISFSTQSYSSQFNHYSPPMHTNGSQQQHYLVYNGNGQRNMSRFDELESPNKNANHSNK